jgi:hypothetical protein
MQVFYVSTIIYVLFYFYWYIHFHLLWILWENGTAARSCWVLDSCTISCDSYCIVSSNIHLVTWRWPSRRVKTCRQLNKINNIKTVVFWLTQILPSFAYTNTTGMMHLKIKFHFFVLVSWMCLKITLIPRPCFMPFCYNAPCQFTQLLNLHSFDFGLRPLAGLCAFL